MGGLMGWNGAHMVEYYAAIKNGVEFYYKENFMLCLLMKKS